MIAKTHRWQRTAIAAAAIALLGLSGTGAYALSLGRLTVQSALGEPLRAEVEVPDITAEEAASLKAAVAQPEAFTAAGLEYSAALTGFSILIGTIGGFGAVFNQVVLNQVRCYNRISVYIGFLCYFATLWYIDRWFLSRTGWVRWLPVLSGALLWPLVVALGDSLTRRSS